MDNSVKIPDRHLVVSIGVYIRKKDTMSPTLKTVLITGCSASGIGAAVALAFLKRGHYVFATARSVSKIPAEIAGSSSVTIIPLDVTSPSSVAEAVKFVVYSGRKLDILFNNAGVTYAMPILDVDVEHAKRVYDVNLWGVVRTVRGFAGLLIESKGRIVNVSTVGAVLNTPWMCKCIHPLQVGLDGIITILDTQIV